MVMIIRVHMRTLSGGCPMARKINTEKLKAFLLKRKANTLGLFLMTFCALLVTLACALTGFPRTDILAFVCILMVLLCIVQLYRVRKAFRTIRSFKGIRRKKRTGEEK